MEKLLDTHVFIFNKGDNSGEQLSLTTKFFTNGDGEIFSTHELVLQSYCAHASLWLFDGMLSPEKLRELANSLDATKAKLPTTQTHG